MVVCVCVCVCLSTIDREIYLLSIAYILWIRNVLLITRLSESDLVLDNDDDDKLKPTAVINGCY